MVKLQAFLAILAALVITPVLCDDGHDRDHDHDLPDVQEVCDRTPELELFGHFLRTHPDVYQTFAEQRNDTLYLPDNKSFREHLESTGGIFRRATSQQALQSCAQGQASANAAMNNHGFRKRAAGGVGLIQKTLNTGSSPNGNNSIVVFKPAINPAPGSPGVSLASGAGVANIVVADLLCKQGIIQVVDLVSTIPTKVTDTLATVGQNKFLEAIEDACIQDSLNTADQITLISPVDSAFKDSQPFDLQNHIIGGVAFYSPDLVDGNVHKANNGGNIYVTVKDGQLFLNCILVLETDILSNNGAIISINGTLTPIYSPPVCSSYT
jgi:hypothetical protein